jgi:Fic family protein
MLRVGHHPNHAHHSTAIEGNTLILKEVERLLRDGKAVGSKEPLAATAKERRDRREGLA